MPISDVNVPVEDIAHVIQVALTPVFLLSGIGTLLNVFNTRLARVSDHTEHTNELLKADPEDEGAALLRRHLWRLHRRRVALDVAIALGAFGGASACGAGLRPIRRRAARRGDRHRAVRHVRDRAGLHGRRSRRLHRGYLPGMARPAAGGRAAEYAQAIMTPSALGRSARIAGLPCRRGPWMFRAECRTNGHR
ncbi:MAG: DUF2721 domain-containing protein [Acetobacteraceae bacterium]